MTNQEAIYQQKYLKEMHNASPEVMESCDMAIKALSVDYEGMTKEIERMFKKAIDSDFDVVDLCADVCNTISKYIEIRE